MTAATIRVLIVEDEPLIAMFIEDTLIEMGHEVGLVATRLDDALRAAETGTFGFAIIDLNLDGAPTYPVADILKARGIPFVFATGFGAAGLDPAHVGAAALQKPFTQAELQAALARATASK